MGQVSPISSVLQPHGFEGLVTVDEDANVADLAVDQVVHVGLRPCNANAAGSARGATTQERDHPLAIDLFYAVKLDPKIGCGFLDVRQETPDAVDSFVHPSNGGHWRLQLDVLGAARAITLDVPRVDRRDRALSQSHVLLRNTRSPARKLRVFIRRG